MSLHRKGHVSPRRFHPRSDANFSTLRELQRVRQQIPEHLRDLRFIGVERRQIRHIVKYEGHRSIEEQRFEHAAKRAEERLHFEIRGPDRALARFDLRQIKQVVDEIRELFGGLRM